MVQRVKVKGNKEFLTLQLDKVISLEGTNIYKRWILRKESEQFFQETLEEDKLLLKSYYQKEGFLDFKYDSVVVIPATSKEKVKVVFYLNEGSFYRIGKINIVVNDNKSVEDFFKGVSLRTKLFNLQGKEGNRFTDEVVYADQNEIVKWFSDKGYPYTSIKTDITLAPDSLRAHVTYFVKTGPLSYFGNVEITGNAKIPKRIIEKQILFKEGTVYQRDMAEETQKRIVDLGAYRVVTITPVLSLEQKDTVPMRILVREAPRLTSRFGIGYGKEEHLRAFVKIQKIGVFGGARRAEFNARTSYLEPYNLSIRFTQPGFIYPLTSLIVYPYLIKQNEPSYELTKAGGAIGLYKTFTKDLIGSTGFSYEYVKLDTTSVAELPSEELLSNYTKSGPVAGLIFDNSMPKFDPSKGFVSTISTKLNGLFLKQDYPLYKFNVELKGFTVPYRKWVLASKIQVGSLQMTNGATISPVEERFFSGGVGSVRGWPRQELGPKDADGVPQGGNSIFEGSAEIRVPLVSTLRFVTFFDGGNVWEEAYGWKLNDLRFSWGAGLRISSPIGPIGFDFARPIFDEENTWQFLINIGPSF